MKERLLSALQVASLPFLITILFWGSPGKTQAQAPANDNCAGAITLTASSTTACTPTTGTTTGATQSLPAISCRRTGSADDDVWYKFTAVATTHTVTVEGAAGFDAIVEVRSGACNGTTVDCADFTSFGGSERVGLTGLTVGTTYYVRVYHYDPGSGSGSFTICVTGSLVANDHCVDAVTLTVGVGTACTPTTGSTTEASQSLPAITCGRSTGIADDDVWYKFTAVATKHVVTVVGNGAFDAIVDVRSGACNGTTIACADATQEGGREMVHLSGLTIGTIYYVRVYSYGLVQSSFTICVNHPPANDDCANAVTLTSGTTCAPTAGTTVGTTQSLPDITCGGSTVSADDDVWYKFTAVATKHTVTVEPGSGFNPVVEVRSGACDGSIIACADDNGFNRNETLNLSGLTIGSTYWVRVYSSNSGINYQATFTICVGIPPANDECANAVALTPGISCTPTNGTTVNATRSLPDITCEGFTGSADDDVWYKFTAISVNHTVTVGGAGFNAAVDIKAGACDGNTIACADAKGFNQQETLNLSGLTIGSIYYVRVYSSNSGTFYQGGFTICVTYPGPPNDDCVNAVALTAGTTCTPTAGTTVNAIRSSPDIACGGSTGSADDDVWYKFTAAATVQIITVVDGAGFDAVVDVRTGACNGTTIACTDATAGTGTETMNLSGLTVGTTYLVRVYSKGGTAAGSGTFTICVENPVDNDDCANAVTLTPNTSCTPTNGTTVNAFQSLPAITCGGSAGSADDDVWYKFTAAATTQTVTAVGNGSFNAVVDVRSGACNGTAIACADATGNGGTETANLSGLTIGSIYYVRIYGRGSALADRGTFTICVTYTPPANDDCANAITLTPGASCTPTAGTTVGATQSLAAITCGTYTGTADDDVWYKFTAVATAHIVTVVGAAGFDAVVDVRTGACNGSNIACADATPSAGTETVRLLGLTIGSTYLVRVYSYNNSVANRGTFTICITYTPPANDECANAVTLTSNTSCTPTAGTTGGATMSLFAITCGETTGTADDDVWYKFTAVATAHIVTVVGAAGFDAVVDVRTGACNGSNIACADATPSAGTETVSLSDLTVGSTYLVRVYSNGGAPANRGNFTICVTHPCPTTLTVTESITSGTVVKEAVKIMATNQVAGGIVSYKAVQSVTLQPGFGAVSGTGTLFQATTGGCP